MKVKALKESEDLEAIKAAGDELSKEAQRVGGAMYAKEAESEKSKAESGEGVESTTKDAEFTEKKDDGAAQG